MRALQWTERKEVWLVRTIIITNNSGKQRTIPHKELLETFGLGQSGMILPFTRFTRFTILGQGYLGMYPICCVLVDCSK